MLAFIGAIVVGLIAGLIARAIKPGNDAMGWIMTILLGVVGSLGATYGGQALGFYQPGEQAGWIVSIIGAIVVLFIYGLVTGKKK